MTIAEHTFDETLLPEAPTVLDVGCRGFAFGDGIRALRQKARIFELDIDDLGTGREYTRAGISDYCGTGGVSDDADPLARRLTAQGAVPVYTLEAFCVMRGVYLWDLIKLDCEGSEFAALLGMGWPRARQISVEFHPWGEHGPGDVDRVVSHLVALGYSVVQHAPSDLGGHLNYWDSLFVRRYV